MEDFLIVFLVTLRNMKMPKFQTLCPRKGDLDITVFKNVLWDLWEGRLSHYIYLCSLKSHQSSKTVILHNRIQELLFKAALSG